MTQRVGLDLILPAACMLPLERVAQWADRFAIPLKVLGGLVDNAEELAAVLTAGAVFAAKFLAKVPRVGSILSKLAIPALLALVTLSTSKLEEIHANANRREGLPHSHARSVPARLGPRREGEPPGQEPVVSLIWATRGLAWGFRFLLDGGYPDPLLIYERAFTGTEGEVAVCRRVGDDVALRLLDPLNGKDEAGRVIPHDFVVRGTLATQLRSAEDGVREVWPLVADVFGQVWDAKVAPVPRLIQAAVGKGLTEHL